MNFPRLFAVVCLPTQTVEYANTRYTAVQGMYKSIPDGIRDNFALVRYDANENYKNKTTEYKE